MEDHVMLHAIFTWLIQHDTNMVFGNAR